jgi:hypothetical protein
MAQLMGNERVDDIPLLLNQIKKVNLIDLVDKHFQYHGNWQGISLGSVVAGCCRILCQKGIIGSIRWSLGRKVFKRR